MAEEVSEINLLLKQFGLERLSGVFKGNFVALY